MNLSDIYYRANELMTRSCSFMMVDCDSWRAPFPPVKVFRALLVNSELESAGKYAEKAFVFAEKGIEKEAAANLEWAERHYAKAEWAREATNAMLHGYEIDWYQATQI